MVKVKLLSSALLAFALISLPACKWFKSSDDSKCASCPASAGEVSNDSSSVLLSINGKSALTAKEFEDFINKASEGNEQIKLMLQFVPDFKEQLFTMKKRAVIISEWAKKKGIRDSKDYKDKEKAIMESVREGLDSEEFLKSYPAEISDTDLKKYYEENKEKDPRIMQSAAGVKAVSVAFNNINAANEFADAVNKAGKDIEKLAKAKKLTLNQLGLVNEESAIDSKIKEKVLSATTFPSIVVVKDAKGKYFVVAVKAKEKAQYRPFEQVKEMLSRLLKPRKIEEMLDLELPKLEKEFSIVENRQYFEADKKKHEAEAQEAAKLTQQNMRSEVKENPAKELSSPKSV